MKNYIISKIIITKTCHIKPQTLTALEYENDHHQKLKGESLSLKKSNTALYLYQSFREAVVPRCSAKKMFLRISQYSKKSTCVGVSFS